MTVRNYAGDEGWFIRVRQSALALSPSARTELGIGDADALARRGEAVFLKDGPNREGTESGYQLCERALAIDATNGRALSILAERFATRITASQSGDRDRDMQTRRRAGGEGARQ